MPKASSAKAPSLRDSRFANHESLRDSVKAAFDSLAPKEHSVVQILESAPEGPHAAGQALDDLLLNMAKHADDDPTEVSFHTALNQVSPHVRKAATLVLKPMVADGPAAHGGNPHKLQPVLDRLVTEDVADGLQKRMGTDADRIASSAPPTTRETLDVAFDLHNPEG